MKNLKSFTTDDVVTVAQTMLKNSSTVTTLEIKDELRNQGFKALQSDVSAIMSICAMNGEFEYKDNGKYREYMLPQTAQMPSNQTSTSVYTYTNVKGKALVPASNTSYGKGCWEVYSVTTNHTVFMPGTYSRDDVRNSYAKGFKENISFIRASKVK